MIKKCKFCAFNMLTSILQQTVLTGPSLKLDHCSLSGRGSSGTIYIKIDLKTSSLNAVNFTLHYSSTKLATKSHVIIAKATGL